MSEVGLACFTPGCVDLREREAWRTGPRWFGSVVDGRFRVGVKQRQAVDTVAQLARELLEQVSACGHTLVGLGVVLILDRLSPVSMCIYYEFETDEPRSLPGA